jgi:peroxiredoxin
MSSTSSAPSIGDSAPDFQLFTDENEPWRLSEHLDESVLLLFFPGAFTSVCTTELNTVNNDRSRFGDTNIVGISTDSPFVLSEFRSVHGFTFPLLSDHDAAVSERYGTKYQNNFTPMNLDRIAKRSAFVVDGEGIIQYGEVLDNAGNQPDFDAIAEVLSELEG